MRTITPIHRLLTVYALLHATSGLAQEPAELSSLRDAWAKARNQAVAPIDKKYVDALEALKLRFTKAGNLASALAVDGELKSLANASSASPAAQGGPPAPETEVATKSGLEKYLADTTWSVVRDSDQMPLPDVTFKSGGEFIGFNKNPKSWRVTAKDRVIAHDSEIIFSADLTRFTVTWRDSIPYSGTLKSK